MSIEGEVSVDQEILNSMGEGDDQGEENTTESTEGITEEAQAAGAGQAADNGTGEESQGQQQGNTNQNVNQPYVPKDGAERRLYNKVVKAERSLSETTNRLAQVEAQLDAVTKMGNLSTQYGITPEEVGVGAQLMKAFNENPVDTVKYLLTQAQAMGHNIDGIGGTTDMSAIRQMMSEMMAPITREHQQRIDTQQNNEAAQRTYNEFMTQFPDAEVHQDSLAQLIQNDQSLSPVAAYYKLQAFYGKNGLDWNKPLDVLKAEHAAKPAPKQVPNEPQRGTIPSGGRIPQQNVTDTADIADVGTSSEDIIRQSMIDAGYQM
jgi:hypothetical protein